MAIPYKCPVCDGTGRVSARFYADSFGMTNTSTSITPVSCRSCFGSGVVWDNTPTYVLPYSQPNSTPAGGTPNGTPWVPFVSGLTCTSIAPTCGAVAPNSNVLMTRVANA